MFDTIYVHAGLPKTGSTYIQNGLQALSLAGKLKHVGYPVLSTEQEFSNIGSGNGIGAANVLLRQESEQVLRKQLDAIVGQLVNAADPKATPDLLISSENFFFATDDGFAALKSCLLQHCRTVKLIIAIRPLREWTYSVYVQRVKGHGFSSDYDAPWLMEYCTTFDRYFASLERRGVETIAFRYQEKNLLRTFLGLIGEDESLAAQVPDVKVNRSLSPVELELVRKVNSYFQNETLSRMISEDLIRNWPDVVSAAFPANREDQYLAFAETFVTKLAHLRSPLLMSVKEILFADAAPAPPGSDGETPSDLFDIVLRNLRAMLDPSLKDAAVYGIVRRYCSTMDRTDDFFDPLHYLLMYPDVVKPGINPWAHFQDHGRKEGRKSAFVKRGVK
ncbi:MAG: hypothetical protein ACREO3_03695 [Arenimonas sp.]